MTIHPAWNDPSLAVESDSPWRARYRRLQSWHRAERLRAAPGPSGSYALVGSMLAADDVRQRPDLNFFDSEVAAYARRRAAEVRAADGTLEVERLTHNMLSSMPLCFNVFGFLRRHGADAAPTLAKALQLPIHEIETIDVEWAPRREEHLGDRTAFDAFVRYRTADRKLGFVGIETKYTEPFSPKKHMRDSYRALTKPPVFRSEGAVNDLQKPATNQLWRNLLLALSVREKYGFDLGHVAVLACEGDPKAKCAVERVGSALVSPGEHLRAVSFETLASIAAERPTLAPWATWFRERYLDWERAA